MTKEYKKVNDKIVDKVNKDDKKVASKLDLDNREYIHSVKGSKGPQGFIP